MSAGPALPPAAAVQTTVSRPRILYYCQSLVGIGHLTCSLRIIEALLPQAEVDLVYGGLDAGPMAPRPGFRGLRLATLLHDEDSGEFFAPADERPIDAIWADRAQAIAGFLRPSYQAVVLEFYPFGRRRFKTEIQALLAAVRAGSGPVPVFCSVREVLVPRAQANERRMVESVKKLIHTVFVRGDPAVIRFDETFSLAPEIADRLCYSGYISPPPPTERPVRKPQVLVSQGGGNVGRELLVAAIGAAALLPQLRFVLACGSRTPAEEIESLRRLVSSANVEIHPFLAEFPRHLMESVASISMGGDNTLMDVLGARTPGLAYPYQDNPEQGIRIRKFAEKGLLHELGPADLLPERLAARILEALAAPYPAHQVAMDGARVTAERILAVLAERAVEPA
ncbi:Putative glycosyl transferase [Rubrivivax sp. A210]|uniref:glycosyltransferase family protein n=1 Tax=Rubrivivax sp. A210 TaxID=2772301 RepID=UPI001918154E|nr:glycosyltransferase [Rubrivivax sp. A210]CAD5373926.1 Putative glycosyl transferase [Rubrivivax sp. A210]